MLTNVPAPSFDDTGLSVPEAADLYAGVFADLNAAFGGNLNPSPSTSQGQMSTSLAAMLENVGALFLLLVNQVDPAFSSGRMQDAIGRMSFLTRMPALPTVVTATCIGASGTAIPAGSLAMATDGTLYQSLAAATIAAGTATIAFAALNTGPIACPAGALSRIYRAVPGWDAITNAAAGVPGRDVESRVDFEARRAASVSVNAAGILPAIRGAVLSIDGVLDAFVTENSSADPLTVGGVTLPAHCLYVAVEGGADADVARAIWSKKAPGCDYHGNRTITVEDQSSGYVAPYPAYNVTFQRPSALPVFMTVTLASSSAVPSNAAALIQAAVLATFNGEDGGSRVRIGTTVYASRFNAGIAALGAWVQIVSVEIGTSPSATGASVPVQIDQFPVIDAGSIAVVLQ